MGHVVPGKRTCHLVLPGSLRWRLSRIGVYAAQLSPPIPPRPGGGVLREPLAALARGGRTARGGGGGGVCSGSRWLRWPAVIERPGDEAGADSRSAHRDTLRLVAFSDAVFAIT